MKISIIMPVYNVENYLAAALDSILQQSFSDFSLICINDGSTDTSASILEKYASLDSRITVINQENKGAGYARNVGLDRVTTEFVTFVDSDDIVHPQFLDLLYTAIDKFNADFVWCRDKKFHAEEELIQEKAILYKDVKGQEFLDIFTHFVMRYDPHPSVMMNKLYRSELLREIRFNEKLRHVEDILFSHYMFHKASNAVFIDIALYYYRQHGTSVSNVGFSPKYIEDHINVGEELARYFATIPMEEEIHRNFWFRTAKMMLKNPLAQPWRKNRKEAVKYWKIYGERLKTLYDEKIFRPEYLDKRNKILAKALLNEQYWLLKCILKLSYW